jgi:signal transduction histidine kinase
MPISIFAPAVLLEKHGKKAKLRRVPGQGFQATNVHVLKGKVLKPGIGAMTNIPAFIFGLFLLVLFQPAASWAADNANRVLHFQILRDLPPDLGIQSVCCGGEFQFEGPVVTSVSTAYGEQSLWLKLQAPIPDGILVLSPVIDDVTLYARTTGAGGWTTLRTGDLVPMTERAMYSPFMALPLPSELSDAPIFIRIIQPTKVSISARVWNPVTFLSMQSGDRTLKTFLFGFLCATIIYNAFVAFLLRDSAFLFNALSIGSLLFLSLYLSGYGAAYVWSEWPESSNFFSQASMFFGVFFGALFMWAFVRSTTEDYWRGWPLFIAPAVASLGAVAALALPYWRIQLWMLVSAALMFVIAVSFVGRRAISGDTKARVLLIPLLLAMIPGTGLVAAQKIFGVESPRLNNNLLEITFCLEALMFSLAIASRIRISELAARESSTKLMSLRNESAARVIAAQDADRQRLAKELHDGVGQDFLVVLGNLKRLGREAENKNWKQAMPGLIDSATTALDELRRISKDMHPASISHLGLEKAIEALFENLESSSQIETNLDLSLDESRLTAEAKLHVYRIVQECLSNVSRHSGASCCRASIIDNGAAMTLTLEDDGTGIEHNTKGTLPTSGLGLTSIEERVRSLDGRWVVSKSELGGAKISVTFPLPSSDFKETGV